MSAPPERGFRKTGRFPTSSIKSASSIRKTSTRSVFPGARFTSIGVCSKWLRTTTRSQRLSRTKWAMSRRGTSQLSKQLLVQAPLALAAGLPASQVWRDEIKKLGIAVGIDAPFLRYNREQELEAGLLAVRLLADARFDPNAFRTLLEKVNEPQTSDAPRALPFVFNHPQSETLSPEIADAVDQFSSPTRTASASVDFKTFRTALLRLPAPAAKLAAVADADPATDSPPNVFNHPLEYYRLAY